MSALEQLPYVSRNRRKNDRVRVEGSIPVIFGRGKGELIDISPSGARIRHFAPVRRGAAVRVSFTWRHTRFSATTEVLSSRVVSLGIGPSYESRVRFILLDDESERALATIVEQIAGGATRRLVANMRGWNDEAQSDPTPVPPTSFIRCRLIGNRWEIKHTSCSEQPEDGFVLRSDSPDADIQTLCDNYSRGNAEDRRLILAMAAAAIES